MLLLIGEESEPCPTINDNGQVGRFRVTVEPTRLDPAGIATALVTAGYQLTALEDEKVNLETAFMRLTKGLVQ